MIKNRIVSAVFLAILLLISPNAFSGEEGASAPNNNPDMIPATTGRIDSIGSSETVIDDTWYKFSEDVSIGEFKVGDRVTFVATDAYEILIIRHAIERRPKKK